MINYYIKKIAWVIGVVTIILLLSRKFIPLFFEHNYKDLENLYKGGVKFIIFCAIVFLIKKDNLIHWKYISKNNLSSLLVIIALLYFSLQHTFTKIEELKISISNLQHYSYLFQCFATGFLEEFVFRIHVFSLVCYAYKKNLEVNNFKPVLMTSFLFAIVHFTNLFNDDFDKFSVINQVMFAFVVGVILQSVFYKWNNIFLNVGIHALINYHGMAKSRLFHIQNHAPDVSDLQNFKESFIACVVLGFFIGLPIFYLSVKNRPNYLIKSQMVHVE